MKRFVRKHPLAIRWFHWINFPMLAIMIWSGLLIYWANAEYSLRVGGQTLFHFFPKDFFKALNVPFRLAEGMSIHFTFMWFFFINGLLYVGYTILSGEWRFIIPSRGALRDAGLVVLHDLHIRRGLPPQTKYNAAQQIAYSGVVIMGLFSILTGLAIYKPIQLHALTWVLGGYTAARLEHFILTILYVLFFLVHVIQVIIAGWNNFQSMVTGLEPVPAEETIITPEEPQANE